MKRLYRSYSESTNIFKELEAKYPNYFKIESIGNTWENREINLITISKDIKTADFNILHVPVSFNDFLKIEIELGKNVLNKNEWKDKFSILAKEKKINLIIK